MLVSVVLSSLVIFLLRKVYAAVPPAACHAPFRWDDCGKEPTPVMYYWKTGSRCEVGMWRGCLPNINMFPDEYECVATCIFSMRAGMQDYHSFNELEEDSEETTRDPYDIYYKDTTEGLNDTNSTEGNDTETDDASNSTTGEPSDSSAETSTTGTDNETKTDTDKDKNEQNNNNNEDANNKNEDANNKNEDANNKNEDANNKNEDANNNNE